MVKTNGIDWKALVLTHIEKVVIGAIAIWFLGLLWQAIRLEGLPEGHDPGAISSEAERASQNITHTDYVKYTQKPIIPKFGDTVMDDLNPNRYDPPAPFDPTLILQKDRRSDPVLLGLREPEIHFDYGPFALLTARTIQKQLDAQGVRAPQWLREQLEKARPKPDPFANRPKIEEGVDPELAAARRKPLPLPGVDVVDRTVAEGRRWVMVCGLVPFADQQEEYNKVFLGYDGFDADNDRPRYMGYEVARAEVSGGQTGEWKTVFRQSPGTKSLQKAIFRWDKRDRQEIIDPRYIDENLTWPLGPRVLVDWAEEDKHSKVPLEKKEKDKKARVPEGDPILNPGRKKSYQQAEEKQEDAPSRMLRYYDFSVEPGKRYRYRFRLILRDANYVRDPNSEQRLYLSEVILPEKYINEEVVARLKKKEADLLAQGYNEEHVKAEMRIRYTEWSEPTRTVKIPLDNRILADGVEPPIEDALHAEPGASILVKTFNIFDGKSAAGETLLQPLGTLGNFQLDDIAVIDPDTKQLKELDYEFKTGAILLDVRGGENVGDTGLEQPGEILMLGQEGKLVVLSEAEDRPAVRAHRELQEKAKRARDRVGPGGGVQGPIGDDIPIFR